MSQQEQFVRISPIFHVALHSGLRTHSNVGSLHVLERPLGAGVNRDVNVLFGHAQLIPTFTLQPAEEHKEPQGAGRYLDPAISPPPRPKPFLATAEGDTNSVLGLERSPLRWDDRVMKPADRRFPLAASVPARHVRATSTERSRSRSPTGRNRLSGRGPTHLSSSLSARSLKQRLLIDLDAAASRDVELGRYRSPHTADLKRTRRYVKSLDEEIKSNARAALEAEHEALRAADHARAARRVLGDPTTDGSTPSRQGSARKAREWMADRGTTVGVHVRGHDMEKQWSTK
jgi:hypothetical protein